MDKRTAYRSISVGGHCNANILGCGHHVIDGILARSIRCRPQRWFNTCSRVAGTGCRWCGFSTRRCHRGNPGLRRGKPSGVWRRERPVCGDFLRPPRFGNLWQASPFHRNIRRPGTASRYPILSCGRRRRPLIGRHDGSISAGFSRGPPRARRSRHLEPLLGVVCDVRRLGVVGLARQTGDVVSRFRLKVERDQTVCDEVLYRVETLLADVMLVVVVQLEILCHAVKSAGQKIQKCD